MGRTRRLRSRKGNTPVNLSSDPSFVRLTRWMKTRGWKQASSLQLAKFVDTGRGLMARRNIQQTDVIVSIPKGLLITTASVLDSVVGRVLGCSLTKPDSFLCQEVLASFLLWERHLGNSSSWCDYIATLPDAFTTPHQLDRYHLNNFPWFLQEQVLCNSELVENCHTHIVALVKNYKCEHCKLSGAELFTWDNFLWGWCCVNTRAVFIEPENVPPHSLLIRDRNCLALAPYLDMFNHSDSAKVTVGLNSSNDCYEIRTLQPFHKFKEVFISYGPHSNTKLYLEYGFILPSTVHDTIPVKFNHLIEACKFAGLNLKFEYEKIQFFQKHGLVTQLYISNSGLSWNCLTLLKILQSNLCNPKCWEQISFMGNDLSLINDACIDNVKKCVLELVQVDINTCQNSLLKKYRGECCIALKNKSSSTSLEILSALLQNFISILKAAENSMWTSSIL